MDAKHLDDQHFATTASTALTNCLSSVLDRPIEEYELFNINDDFIKSDGPNLNSPYEMNSYPLRYLKLCVTL